MILGILLVFSLFLIVCDLIATNRQLIAAGIADPLYLLNRYVWPDWYGTCLWVMAVGLWCEITIRTRFFQAVVQHIVTSEFLLRMLLATMYGKTLTRHVVKSCSYSHAIRLLRYATAYLVVIIALYHVVVLRYLQGGA